MKYVMSDIHGQYYKFMEMLDKINFDDNDELYILGDVMDRGEKSLEIIDHIMKSKNIYMIMGNHEKMYLEAQDDYLNKIIWYKNGGDKTEYQLLYKDDEYKENLYNFIYNLPHIMVKDNFIFVHAGIYLPQNNNSYSINEILDMQEEDILLWDRTFIENDKFINGYTVICGHTPIQTLNNFNGNIAILRKYGKILIDCACFDINGKLACLRLDDMKEFLV